MANDFDRTDMYDTDDYEPPKVQTPGLNVATLSKGMVTEIDINGKKFDVVSPEYVKDMQRLMLDMSNKIKVLDSNLQSMSFASKQQQRMIADLRNQLDGKIDRV